jgi:hypothetical protein
MDKDPTELTDAEWREMWERARPQLREADRVAAPLFWRQMEGFGQDDSAEVANFDHITPVPSVFQRLKAFIRRWYYTPLLVPLAACVGISYFLAFPRRGVILPNVNNARDAAKAVDGVSAKAGLSMQTVWSHTAGRWDISGYRFFSSREDCVASLRRGETDDCAQSSVPLMFGAKSGDFDLSCDCPILSYQEGGPLPGGQVGPNFVFTSARCTLEARASAVIVGDATLGRSPIEFSFTEPPSLTNGTWEGTGPKTQDIGSLVSPGSNRIIAMGARFNDPAAGEVVQLHAHGANTIPVTAKFSLTLRGLSGESLGTLSEQKSCNARVVRFTHLYRYASEEEGDNRPPDLFAGDDVFVNDIPLNPPTSATPPSDWDQRLWCGRYGCSYRASDCQAVNGSCHTTTAGPGRISDVTIICSAERPSWTRTGTKCTVHNYMCRAANAGDGWIMLDINAQSYAGSFSMPVPRRRGQGPFAVGPNGGGQVIRPSDIFLFGLNIQQCTVGAKNVLRLFWRDKAGAGHSDVDLDDTPVTLR